MVKTFWDIEKEKTGKIYLLLIPLFLFYLVPFFIVFLFIRLILYARGTLSFSLGWDAVLVVIGAGVVSFLHWQWSSARATERILRLLNAKLPDRRDRYHQIFQNIVDEIEVAAGGIKVERYIIPTIAMNAFALADFRGRQVIGVTEGLISRLSRSELASVVAHEMAHIVSGDCLLTTITCSLFAVYSEILDTFQKLSERELSASTVLFEYTDAYSQKRGGALLALPLVFLIFVINLISQILNVFISRAKEYRADAAAVRYSRDPLSLAHALHKIGNQWRGAGLGGEYLSAIFILSPRFNVLEEQDNFWANLFSTHPPLLNRLRILLNMGHTDFDELNQEIIKSRSMKVEADRPPEMKFLIEHKGEWVGPYTIKQLMTIEWLGPEVRLRIEDEDNIMRANEIEDLRIFFKAREDPIWHIRRICPICSRWLIVENYEGVNLHFCPFCNGFLIDKEMLPRIIVRREKGFNEEVIRLARVGLAEAHKKHPRLRLLLDMSHPRRCGKCGHPMVHRLYSYAYHIKIDECPRCHLIWFDPMELEILQCMIEMSAAKAEVKI